MNKKLPARLIRGDTIGIAAPSGRTFEFQTEINDGIKILKKRGYKTILSENFHRQDGDSAGNPAERAKAINDFFAHKQIKAVWCSNGGDSAKQILNLINYKLISRNPKIILGFSDNTHLILAINKKSNLVTFHGPNLKDLSRLEPDCLDQIFRLLEKPEELKYPSTFEVVRPGKTTGKLIGGNLYVLNNILSTDFRPRLENSILFFEDIDDEISKIDTELERLKSIVAHQKIRGLIVGHIVTKKKINELLKRFCQEQTFPVIKVGYFGHEGNQFLPLPLGIRVKIDTSKALFELAEPALI